MTLSRRSVGSARAPKWGLSSLAITRVQILPLSAIPGCSIALVCGRNRVADCTPHRADPYCPTTTCDLAVWGAFRGARRQRAHSALGHHGCSALAAPGLLRGCAQCSRNPACHRRRERRDIRRRDELRPAGGRQRVHGKRVAAFLLAGSHAARAQFRTRLQSDDHAQGTVGRGTSRRISHAATRCS